MNVLLFINEYWHNPWITILGRCPECIFGNMDACFSVIKARRDQRLTDASAAWVNQQVSFCQRWTADGQSPCWNPFTLTQTLQHTQRHICASLSTPFRSSMPSLSLASWIGRGDSSAEPWHWPMCQRSDNVKHVNVDAAHQFQWATVTNTQQ